MSTLYFCTALLVAVVVVFALEVWLFWLLVLPSAAAFGGFRFSTGFASGLVGFSVARSGCGGLAAVGGAAAGAAVVGAGAGPLFPRYFLNGFRPPEPPPPPDCAAAFSISQNREGGREREGNKSGSGEESIGSSCKGFEERKEGKGFSDLQISRASVWRKQFGKKIKKGNSELGPGLVAPQKGVLHYLLRVIRNVVGTIGAGAKRIRAGRGSE